MIRHGLKPTSVMQEWTHELSFMQQTVLLTAIRGPDGVQKYSSVKMLLRWYRRCVLLSAMDGRVIDHPAAAGGGSFTGPSYTDNTDHWTVNMDDIVSAYLREADTIPNHFQTHLMHAFEIVGYKHPDEEIRDWFNRTYVRLVHDLHLWPETEAQLDERLGDSRDGWLKRADSATIA